MQENNEVDFRKQIRWLEISLQSPVITQKSIIETLAEIERIKELHKDEFTNDEKYGFYPARMMEIEHSLKSFFSFIKKSIHKINNS